MKSLCLGLVGNPNSGKSTLFNCLTGGKEKVGNWSGVTVEKKFGQFNFQHTAVTVVDLPGVYSLVSVTDDGSLDERIATEFISSQQTDAIINIIDASNLERNLYLTLQLLEMGTPVIIALNMMDVARSRKINIDIKALSKRLGCEVIAIECKRDKGIDELKQAVINIINDKPESEPHVHNNQFNREIKNAISNIADQISITHPELKNRAQWYAMRLLEDDIFVKSHLSETVLSSAAEIKRQLEQSGGEDADILIADARYTYVNHLTHDVVTRGVGAENTFTHMLDRLVLNRILGVPIFLTIMYLMFLFAINIGGALQDFFDIGSDTIFVHGFAQALTSIGTPSWLNALLTTGIGKGINTTITFIPVIGAMFLFLAFLEDSGYMARAAFVMDRFMRSLGLPGKSFVPLIVGFGCNVPAIMAARTLENRRDRILTVMMSPFMSCGARLAIFAVFTAAFFPVGGQNIVFALYIIGILSAMLTGFILRKTILRGDTSPLVMELPPYHAPKTSVILHSAWSRLKNFIFKAGRFIIPICVLIGVLNSINTDGSLSLIDADSHSLLSMLGHVLTPIFAPLGIHKNNWPATVGLLTGVLAKEVVIATLNTLYSQAGHITQTVTHFNFWAGIHAALISIPNNFLQLGSAFSNPIMAGAPSHRVSQGVFGQMYLAFDGKVSAFAYLIFVLLYIPCVSTAAVMARELGKGWMAFSLLWNTSLAYGMAAIFYQAATITAHPVSSIDWIVAILVYFALVFIGLRIYARPEQGKPILPSASQAKGASL